MLCCVAGEADDVVYTCFAVLRRLIVVLLCVESPPLFVVPLILGRLPHHWALCNSECLWYIRVVLLWNFEPSSYYWPTLTQALALEVPCIPSPQGDAYLTQSMFVGRGRLASHL